MSTPEQQRLLEVIRRYAAPTRSADGLLPADSLLQGVTRRRFMQLLGASLALAGLEGCRGTPPEEVLPYTYWQPEVTPGRTAPYATSLFRGGYAVGMLASTREGRPIKLEGHPEHPASLGGSGAIEQAELLSLYDPARAQALWSQRIQRSWDRFVANFGPGANRPFVRGQGQGLHLLLEPSSSPWLGALWARVQERYPQAQLHFDDSLAPLRSWQGLRLAFGQSLDVHHDLGPADVVVSLDSDFLLELPATLRYARQLGRRRLSPETRPTRLYVAEPSLTVTGSSADRRLALPAHRIERLAHVLWSEVARRLGLSALRPPDLEATALDESTRRMAASMARDLVAHRGRCVVLAGERQPPEVHVLAQALNSVLDATGTTTHYTEPVLLDAASPERFQPQPLLDALDAGAVDALLVLGPNPAFTAPPDLDWSQRATQARDLVHLARYENETTEQASWFLPQAHPLESWGDGRAFDGTVSFVQPAIRPLYDGRQVEQVLAALLGETRPDPRQMLQAYWRTQQAVGEGEQGWHEAIRRGLLPDSQLPPMAVELQTQAVTRALRSIATRAREQVMAPERVEVALDLDPRILDGRFANNAWLQELPEPISKLVWDNAALMAPADAQRWQLETGDMVELRLEERQLQVPVFVQPGQAPGSLGLWLGHGRRAGAPVAQGMGFDANLLRTAASPWISLNVVLQPIPQRYRLVVTQQEPSQHERPLALRTSLEQFRQDPHVFHVHNEVPPSIHPERLEGSPQWGMSIDLNACTGCSACVVACQAENNIPVVGKDQVHLNREMHWLRIDRYYAEDERGELQINMQPMLCQHCEKAPCEYVCPVNATVHSPDGLNEMIYNRCVGTRFCSNNCPYKIRHFNYYEYNDQLTDVERMGKNPDVTVRARGVIEKCTFCVQRIRRQSQQARVEGRPLRDGEIRTACQQACPSEAIQFGDITDRESQVSQRLAEPRTYAVLNEIGTRPRVRYLARIDNLPSEDER